MGQPDDSDKGLNRGRSIVDVIETIYQLIPADSKYVSLKAELARLQKRCLFLAPEGHVRRPWDELAIVLAAELPDLFEEDYTQLSLAGQWLRQIVSVVQNQQYIGSMYRTTGSVADKLRVG